MTFQKKYSTYRKQLQKLQEQIDAWYTIASQKFSEGNTEGQAKAYTEISTLQEKIDALINPLEENDELINGDAFNNKSLLESVFDDDELL